MRVWKNFMTSLSRSHDRRLRQMYRSAGWPCLDTIEIDLLAAGLLERISQANGTDCLRVTDAGIKRISETLERNRGALDQHEALVALVAERSLRDGRIAYCGLNLRSKPGEEWINLRPDVYSIRRTTVEAYVEPIIYEIKVKRSDLLADLKKPEKRLGYIELASECYYVLAEKVGVAEDIPTECGVILVKDGQFEQVRAAPKRPMTLSFQMWMALAKADRFRTLEEPTPLL